MAKTIALSAPAYARLKKQKLTGESFSDVVLREIPEVCNTAGELLDSLKNDPPPAPDPALLAAWRGRRGRHSNRKPTLRRAA
jgi:hypothetical protein